MANFSLNDENQIYCVYDFETRSRADLKRCGAYEYARDPSTRILCSSHHIGTRAELRAYLERREQPREWSPFLPEEYPCLDELIHALVDPNVILVAQNAFFEQVITRFVLPRYVKDQSWKKLIAAIQSIPPERYLCTAALLGSLALPRRLEGGAKALGLPFEKDMPGHKLMLKYCKPRKPTKKNPALYHNNADDLRRLIEYCSHDTMAEIAVFLDLPPLIPQERKVWELDQKINWRGFKVDRELVAIVLRMIEEETSNLNAETADITMFELASAMQRDGLLDWLESEGVVLPNLQAKTVSDAIASGLITGDHKRVLEIRQAISKTSTAKYHGFIRRTVSDGCLRDNLVYHTASTGRWGGAGIQPQNFPRGIQGYNAWYGAEILRDGDLDLVRTLFGDPMNAFASCLRAMIVAREGKEFFCADYVGIELHVLFWMAKHEEGLRALRERIDMYVDMAVDIYGKPASEISKESRERFIGKESVLGCGYQMGGPTFRKNCIKKGVPISDEDAKLAVQKYREKHYPVKKMWYNTEKAAVAAVKNPGKKYTVNRVSWFVRGKFLFAELPSGRRLAYYGPEIKYERNKWAKELEPKLYHWGVDSLTKQWKFGPTYGGKLTENVVQAVARDLMAEAMLRIDSADFDIVLSVHDELLAEAETGKKTIEEFKELMAELPSWAEGLIVRVEGWSGKRYRK